jgi:hypothetical protein
MLEKVAFRRKPLFVLATFFVGLAAGLVAVAEVTAAEETTREETVSPSPTPKFIPPHVGNGDREFNGHGPVMKVRVDLFVRGGKLWARVHLNAKETCADWTEADGHEEYLIYTPPSGQVVGLANGQESVSTLEYTDTNHEDDVFTRGPADPVKKYTCSGDRKGDDAGVHTGVQLDFNRVAVLVKK